MTTSQGLASVAAAAVVLWPWVYGMLSKVRVPRLSSPVKSSVGYEAAIHNLAVVRSRLLATSLLNDEQKKAIDTLTLALVAGSDQ